MTNVKCIGLEVNGSNVEIERGYTSIDNREYYMNGLRYQKHKQNLIFFCVYRINPRPWFINLSGGSPNRIADKINLVKPILFKINADITLDTELYSCLNINQQFLILKIFFLYTCLP